MRDFLRLVRACSRANLQGAIFKCDNNLGFLCYQATRNKTGAVVKSSAKGVREVPVLDHKTALSSGPPDTYINSGYVVVPDGEGGINDVVKVLKETLTVQLLAAPKVSHIIAQSYVDLAMAEHTALLTDAAASHYRQAIDIYQKLAMFHDDGDPAKSVNDSHQDETQKARLKEAQCWGYLAVVLRDCGELEKSLDAIKHSRKMKEELVGNDHPMMVDTLHNAGSLYQMKGDYDAAIDQYEHSIRCLLSATNGEVDSPYLALSYYNLGCCHHHLGQHLEAKTSLNRSLKIAKCVFGDEHVITQRIIEMWTTACGENS